MKDMTIRQEIDQHTIWAYMKKVKWGKKGLTTIVDIRYKPTVEWKKIVEPHCTEYFTTVY